MRGLDGFELGGTTTIDGDRYCVTQRLAKVGFYLTSGRKKPTIVNSRPVTQRWMMLDPPSPVTLRQNLAKVSTPTRRAFTASPAERFRRVKESHPFVSHTVRRFRFL